MSKNQVWGIYAPYIRQFINIKRSLGFKYVTEEYIYKYFDQLSIERGETEVGITKELADEWCERRNNESDSYRFHRCVCALASCHPIYVNWEYAHIYQESPVSNRHLHLIFFQKIRLKWYLAHLTSLEHREKQ